LANVFTLRSLADCDRIREAMKSASRAVVVGASFIGMETAAGLRDRGLSVDVLGRESIPFERSLGEQIGRMYQKIHEDHGVRFHLNAEVDRFEGDGKVRAVVLKNGSRLDADLVIVGVGVQPATGFLKGVQTNPDGSVTVDEHFRLKGSVYAAGDIARFPDWRTGELIRIEHWCLAEQQGRVAACNMAGHETVYRSVPFFWTNQFKVIVQYVGHARAWDEIIFQGSPDEHAFLAFYAKGNRVLAVAGADRDRQIAAAGELIRLDRMPTPQELKDGAVDLLQRLEEIKAPA
jgi:NADPH-dependent 2,4-dienoyl-CoA reductase/sulfur reductase-like enzyme